MTTITLKPELETWARTETEKRGLPDVSAFVNEVLEQKHQQADPPEDVGDAAIRRMRTAKTNGITFDEIAEMTRSDM